MRFFLGCHSAIVVIVVAIPIVIAAGGAFFFFFWFVFMREVAASHAEHATSHWPYSKS